jgi:hypothetical protein
MVPDCGGLGSHLLARRQLRVGSCAGCPGRPVRPRQHVRQTGGLQVRVCGALLPLQDMCELDDRPGDPGHV